MDTASCDPLSPGADTLNTWGESPPAHGVGAWPVAVFAHNEADRIERCLEGLTRAAPGRRLRVFVLANGCTDRTEDIVRDYARHHPVVRLVSIALPDKVHAWNVYVHHLAPAADIHFFTDGDVEVTRGSLERLHEALASRPRAHAAAALPGSGRSRRRWRRSLIAEAGLVGNLYALRGTFLDRLRAAHVRLPIGFTFEDGLVGALAKWDLRPDDRWDDSRIVVCPSATFVFPRLRWQRPADWSTYVRRRLRYAFGHYQVRMLAAVLRRDGLRGVPATVAELYALAPAPLSHERAGLNAIFDRIATWHLRRHHMDSIAARVPHEVA